MSSKRPPLSIVVTARNDDYGGNFTPRMNTFLNQTTLWSKSGLEYELIVVEWNPPPQRPKLKDALTWPEPTRDRVRLIEVTEQTHSSLPLSDKINLYEFAGKNVGIRRAKGQFVLSTNVDILFSPELVKFLSHHKFSNQCFYRANRFDLSQPIPTQLASVTDQLDFCARNFTKINLRGETINFHGKHPGFKNLTLALARYRLDRIRRRRLRRTEDLLHTNASGDFMLMSRDSWEALRGHPEAFISNSHLDAFVCAMAASSGLRQIILNDSMRVYHLFHKSLDDAADLEGQALYSLWVDQARKMLENARPVIYNTENWGLAGVNCEETHL